MLIHSLAPGQNAQVSSNAGVSGRESNSRPASSEPTAQCCFTGGGYEYAQEAVSMKVCSKDGDRFELTYASQTLTGLGGSGGQGNRAASLVDVAGNITQFINDQQNRFLEILMEEEGNSLSKIKNNGVNDSVAGVLDVPEYWNAENTSQRIADFAVSFFEISGKEADEFGKMIIEAVEEGFKQARGILGSMPDEVNGLISDTETLTLEKINAWVAERSSASETVAA